jgi:hypothetical protein
MVSGSRTWSDRTTIRLRLAVLKQECEARGDELTVIHGDAPDGADVIADMVCKQLGIPVTPYPADWYPGGVYDRRAGYKRNVEMLETCPDRLLAFHRGGSPGTAHAIDSAEARGIPVEVVRWPSRMSA